MKIEIKMFDNLFKKKFKGLKIEEKLVMVEEIVEYSYQGEIYTPVNKELRLNFLFMKKLDMEISTNGTAFGKAEEDSILTYNLNIEKFCKLLLKDKVLKQEYDSVNSLVKDEIKVRMDSESAINQLLNTINTQLKNFDMKSTISELNDVNIDKVKEIGKVANIFANKAGIK